MGNTHIKPRPRTRNKKQVHWKTAERPSPPGKPYLIPQSDHTPDVVTIRWSPPKSDGGSPITGYLVEHRRTGSTHWVRASPLLVKINELALSGLEPGWRYQFRVSAENVVGMSDPGEVSEPLTITLQRSAITAPLFTEELKDTVALENERTDFVVHFLGQPPPSVCWFKDGFEIFSSRTIRITTELDRSTLTIHQTSLGDEGEIKCTATNKAGHASTKAKLTIEAPPRIRLPRQYEEGLLFELEEDIRLKVSIAGRPAPLVFWFHDGESIQNSDRIEIETVDRHSALKINGARRSDRGEYQIKAMNKLGEDRTSFLVTVTDKPSSPGQARVVMTLGRSVTLSWSIPEDDGGCKIGNYIVEYYRLGWNVWLKAATTRQLTTILGDLIEGSEYKFRVKAVSPYGVSDPSEESETVFIPDPKRGITSPAIRSRSQPRDIFDDMSVFKSEPHSPVMQRNKPHQRSQSSTRVEKSIHFSDPATGPPVRPERRIKSPPKTPEISPYPRRKQLVPHNIDKDIFGRNSIVRELTYGSPDLRMESSGSKSRSPSPQPTPARVLPASNLPIKPQDTEGNNIHRTTIKNEYSPPSSLKSSAHSKSPIRSMSPIRNKSPVRNMSPIRNMSPSLRKSPIRATKSPVRNNSPVRGRSQSPLKQINTSQVRSAMKDTIKESGNSPVMEKRTLTQSSPESERQQNISRQKENFTGSSEFMLVLYPDENEKGLERPNFEDDAVAPPLSLSAPELGAVWPDWNHLRSYASSSELLHERAMDRFYEAARLEEQEIERRRKAAEERKVSVDIPRIQINSIDEEDEISLERRLSFRRMSAGTVKQPLKMAVQRRHSLKTFSDVSEVLEPRLHKTSFTLTDKRDLEMKRQRSFSEEKEEEEFEKVRARMAMEKQNSLEKKEIPILDESKWDNEEEYEESISEESTTTSEDDVSEITIEARRISIEEETYHPRMIQTQTPQQKKSEPFEILTKPLPLPDPNFVPKPILKHRENEYNASQTKKREHKSRNRSLSLTLPEEEQTTRQRSLSLAPKVSDAPNGERSFTSDTVKAISVGAQLSGIAAAGIVIPEVLLKKQKAEEEAKIVADHYGDLVKSYGQKSRQQPKIYTDREALKKAAEMQDDGRQQEEISDITRDAIVTSHTNSTENNSGFKIGLLKDNNKLDNPIKEDFASTSKRDTMEQTAIISRSSVLGDSESGQVLPPKLFSRSSILGNPQEENARGRDTQSQNPIKPSTRNPSPRPKSYSSYRKTSKSPTTDRMSPKSRTTSSSWSSSPSPPKYRPSSSPSRSPSPVPFHKRRPKMREITTQTSLGLFETYSTDSYSRSSTPGYSQEELVTMTKVRVRSAIDYLTDLAMFAVACWLYVFDNELLAIPVLLVMVYRQVSEELRRRLPKWKRFRFWGWKKDKKT